jgi:hypothetical protein
MVSSFFLFQVSGVSHRACRVSGFHEFQVILVSGYFSFTLCRRAGMVLVELSETSVRGFGVETDGVEHLAHAAADACDKRLRMTFGESPVCIRQGYAMLQISVFLPGAWNQHQRELFTYSF